MHSHPTFHLDFSGFTKIFLFHIDFSWIPTFILISQGFFQDLFISYWFLVNSLFSSWFDFSGCAPWRGSSPTRRVSWFENISVSTNKSICLFLYFTKEYCIVLNYLKSSIGEVMWLVTRFPCFFLFVLLSDRYPGSVLHISICIDWSIGKKLCYRYPRVLFEIPLRRSGSIEQPCQ